MALTAQRERNVTWRRRAAYTNMAQRNQQRQQQPDVTPTATNNNQWRRLWYRVSMAMLGNGGGVTYSFVLN